MSELFDHKAALKTIPDKPGCYIMRDRRGKIVYIGKAKNLKNRVRSYFGESSDLRAFVHVLPRVLGSIETMITANNKEAMILENTLIKAHKPKFNVRLKDDSNFLSIRVDTKKEWPRIEVVRKQKKDGAKYFGPYHNAKSIRRTLGILNRHFQLRTCPDSILKSRNRPCLQYQIKRCPAPCVFDVDKEDYDRSVRESLMFLEGRAEELVDSVRDRMYAASEEMQFELAATFRDQIESIERSLQAQTAVSTKWIDQDAIGFYRQGEQVLFQLLTVRSGRLEGGRSFTFEHQTFPDAEILSTFINQYYADQFVPKEVLIPFELPDEEAETFGELLGERKGQKVSVIKPQRGTKFALMRSAEENAKAAFDQKFSKEAQKDDLLNKLQERLHLKRYPAVIECYDISNFQGSQIVASQVVFAQGEPDKNAYRHYKMRDVVEQDDFGSMREVLMRRFLKVVDGEEPGPDLLIVDGGKGQLAQATAILDDLGITDIDVVSLAKARVDKSGFEDPEVTRSPERVFLVGRKNPVILRKNSAELYLLERLRNEAHRFAITFHKNLRRKETLRSILDDIPGVGKQTKKDLLKHFGSLKKVKAADVSALQEVSGVGPKLATTIFEFLSPQ